MNPRLHVRSARWISTFGDAGIIVVHVVVSAVHPVGQNVWWTQQCKDVARVRENCAGL